MVEFLGDGRQHFFRRHRLAQSVVAFQSDEVVRRVEVCKLFRIAVDFRLERLRVSEANRLARREYFFRIAGLRFERLLGKVLQLFLRRLAEFGELTAKIGAAGRLGFRLGDGLFGLLQLTLRLLQLRFETLDGTILNARHRVHAARRLRFLTELLRIFGRFADNRSIESARVFHSSAFLNPFCADL